MRPPADVALLAAIAERDMGALRTLHDRHAPWLVARLRRRCSDPEIVAEVVQDTFLAVWKSAHRYAGTGEVAAWIWGIGVRQLIGRLRKRSTPIPVDDVGSSAEPTWSAEDAVLVGVEHGDLAGALRQLSPELLAVVQATVLDGLTTREASRLLDIPTGTVKTRMRRARIELRGALT